MKNKISVFVPIYKESEVIYETLEKLVKQKADKEIFVVIDEPTPKALKKLKGFGKKIRLIVNPSRIGKANALNEAVKHSNGQILFFLDADNRIPNGLDFLEIIEKEMNGTDILDLKKEAEGETFLSRMTYYEYLGLNIGTWLVSHFTGKCPAMNGAAFAIKRKAFESLGGFRRVVTEDLDIATRAFVKGYSFKYTSKAKTINHVHVNWKNWLSQRRRWSEGTGQWFKEWHKVLLKNFAITPQVFVPGMFFIFPSITIFLLNFLATNLIPFKTTAVFLLLLSMKFNFALPMLVMTSLGIDVIKNLVLTLLSFVIFALLFFEFSRKLGFRFRFHEFFAYYFFYSPLCLSIMVGSLIKALFTKGRQKISDWKV